MTLQVFGLTGGIGSGKSAVAARFRARGLPVVDADELSRRAVAAGSSGLEQLVAHFGPGVLRADGELDRAGLGRLVFVNDAERRALDAIVHPLVRQLAQERLQAIADSGQPLACYEVPLLFEVGLENSYRPVVVVDAPLGQRKARLAARDGLDEAQIEARISAQMPLEEKVRRADYVIDNSRTLGDLRVQSDAVLDALCEALGIANARYPQ